MEDLVHRTLIRVAGLFAAVDEPRILHREVWRLGASAGREKAADRHRRSRARDAEFVSYAYGDHSLSRHSKTDALDANRRILEWFDRYVKGDGTAKSQ